MCFFFGSIQSSQQITLSLLESVNESDSVVEIDATVNVESNATRPPRSKEDSFADMIDRALEELNETDQNEGLPLI